MIPEQEIEIWKKGDKYSIRFVDMCDGWMMIKVSLVNKEVRRYVKIEDLMAYLISDVIK